MRAEASRDGGPAYPCPADGATGDWIEGLTKREVFAKEAMKVILAHELARIEPLRLAWTPDSGADQPEVDILAIAGMSFAMADGMIQAAAVV